jgi:membrane protein YqaA with SNARE-associated domain
MTIKSTTGFFKKHGLRILGFLLAILISVLVFVFRDKLANLQSYGYLGLFLLNILGSATIFLPTPLFLTSFVAASIFNPFLVAIVSSVGSTFGELTGYLAGYGAEDIIEKDIKIQKVKRWMDKYGLWVLFILGLVPNPFFDIAGIIAGATEIPVWKFLAVVWAGKLIKFLVIAYAGANSVALIDKFI